MKHCCLFSALAMLMFMISSCAMMPTVPPNPSNPVKSLAVLPLVNNTNDVDAPRLVREKLVEAISNRHYAIMPVEEADRRLRDQLGITLGGQLAAATSDQLRSVLEVDGLIYGTLMDFQEVTTGLYNVKKVRARFHMLNTLNNSTMWENGIGVKSEVRMAGDAGLAAGVAANIADRKEDDVPWVTIDSQTSQDDFKTTLAKNLATKLLSKATGTHLARETNEMIKRVLENFPAGPGVAVSFDSPGIPDLPPINVNMMTPTVGHMDFGDRDFSAVMITTWNDTRQKEAVSWKMPLAKRAQRVRMEMDYSRMAPDSDSPVQLGKVIMLYQGDKQTTYSLYPDRKKYIEYRESDRQVFEKPDMTLTRVGVETIDGHPTIKYSLKMRLADGTTGTGYIWNATDLENMTIKTYLEYDQANTTMLLTDIRIKTPPASLFDVPDDFARSESMMDMMITR